ncbi:NAD-dependent epimerase/dehydratase family protein [Chloroflexota bacterium]
MKVLVLGGNGLFGRKTVIHLAQDPEVETVVAMDVTPVKDWVIKSVENHKDKFHFVRGSVAEIEDILDAIKAYKIDKLVNWAFLLPGVIEGQARLSVKVNALGMCNAFEAARLTGITRVVYASSAGVYGPQHEYGDRDVTEDDMMHPQSGYALMKQYSEILAQQYTDQYGMNFSALRPTIGYGHGGLTPMGVKWFSDICSLPAVGKTFSIDGDGTNTSSLAVADDVAEITRLLLHMPSSPHSAYNVGGRPTSMKEVGEAVRKYIPDAKIEFGTQAPPAGRGQFGPPSKVSMDRAKEDLGFTLLPLEKAVLTVINDARLEAGLEPIKG